MIIFGAGASYDSVDVDAPGRPTRDAWIRPPLANELFADRPDVMGRFLSRYPPVAAIAAEVRAAAGGRAVEDVLADYQERSGLDGRIASQLVYLRYYLREVLTACGQWHYLHQGVTNYRALLEFVLRERPEEVLLVTFNYDQMIEFAMQEMLGTTFDDLDRYVAGPLKLIKPHGSVNWVRVIGMRHSDRTEAERQVLELDPLTLLSSITDRYDIARGTRSEDQDGNLALPALAVPLRAKDGFECPPSHLGVLTNRLGAVTRVLTIGWRGGELLYLKLVAGILPSGVDIDIVSTRTGADETRLNLEAAGINGDCRYLDIGFSGLIRRAAKSGRFLRHSDFAEWNSPPAATE